MSIQSGDIVSFSKARANLTNLAEEAFNGQEKIITRKGKSYVALINAERLDYYHRLEREHIHLQLLDEALAGLQDVKQKNYISLSEFRKKFKSKKF